MRRSSVVPALFLAALATVAGADSAVQAADLPRPAPTLLDTISPTVPLGFAADLPRSPLADVIENGDLRFVTVEEAHRRCPGDDVVRVETFSNVYRPAAVPGPGMFMCKSAALQEGDRPR